MGLGETETMSTLAQAFPATLFLFAYNQADTIVEAAMSCLSQVCEPIEIIFSDDCSTDDTFDKLCQVAKEYKGLHKVSVRRNETNLGIAGHYNQAVACAKSDLIVVAAGDDLSEPQRVQSFLNAWRLSDGTLNLMASYATDMRKTGELLDLIQTGHLERWSNAATWCKKRPYVIGATFAFHKRLFAQFGPLVKGVDYEDQVLSLRAAVLGGGWTIKEPLIKYRQGGLSARAQCDPQSLLAHAGNKYRRQLAVYTQITQDLRTVGESHLAQGKIAKYIHKSVFALHLINEPTITFGKAVSLIAEHSRSVGVFWLLTRYLYIKHPSLASFLGRKI
jgi:glycosyltransferase involved in cell wall biosynthesis